MKTQRFAFLSFWAPLLTLVLIWAIWRLNRMLPFGWQADEGAHVMSGYWLSKGYQLYKEVGVFLWPLLLEWLGLVYRVTAPTLPTARVVILAFGALYLMASALCARAISGRIAGLVAAAALMFDFRLFKVAGLALSEVPTLAAAATATWFVLLYLEKGNRLYLATAGLACSMGLLIKPLWATQPLWLAVVVLTRAYSQSQRRAPTLMMDLLVLLVAGLLPLGVFCLFYGPQIFLSVMVLSPWDLRQGSWTLSDNWRVVSEYLMDIRGTVLMALAGVPWLLNAPPFQRRKVLAIWLLLLMGVAFLLWHSPLFDRHPVLLSLPLAILAGYAVEATVWRSRAHKQRGVAFLTTGLLALGVVLLLVNAGAMFAWEGYRAARDQGEPEAAAVRWLQTLSAPEEIILSDDLTLALVAGRYSPPKFSDVSFARMQIGEVNDTSLIHAAQTYNVQTLCLWSKRFERLGVFVDWAETHFVSTTTLGERHRILHGRRYENEDEIVGLRRISPVTWGDSVALIGYGLGEQIARGGSPQRLVLYWKCLQSPNTNYEVALRILKRNGQPIVTNREAPVNGLYPTSAWRPNEIVGDLHTLPKEIIASGHYVLLVGLYDPASGYNLTGEDGEGSLVGPWTRLVEVDAP